jgi:hypothetical protein
MVSYAVTTSRAGLLVRFLQATTGVPEGTSLGKRFGSRHSPQTIWDVKRNPAHASSNSLRLLGRELWPDGLPGYRITD